MDQLDLLKKKKNTGSFRECKGNLRRFHLSQSVSEQSLGHLILVAEQSRDILYLSDSKAKETISSGNRRWEVGGRGRAEGIGNNFVLKNQRLQGSCFSAPVQELPLMSIKSGCHDGVTKTRS